MAHFSTPTSNSKRVKKISPSPLIQPSPRSQFESEPFIKYQLMMEYTALRNPKHCPKGMYIMPSPETINLWYGVLFISSGLYKNAVFKFRMSIPFDYPNRCPSIGLLTDVFHPLIGSDGSVSITPYIQWIPGSHFTFTVLHLLRRIFTTKFMDNEIELSHAYNKDAWRMYKEKSSMFAKLAAQTSQLSLTEGVLYDPHPETNPIKFSPLSSDKFEKLKQQFMSTSEDDSSTKFERHLRDGLNSLRIGFNKFITGQDL